MSLALTGNGLWLWRQKRIEGGDPTATAALCVQYGARRAYIKVADGAKRYARRRRALADALRAAGVEPWGWSYVYDQAPVTQADALADAAAELGLAGVIVNAEIEFSQGGSDVTVAERLLARLRQRLPTAPIGWSSFKFPRNFPAYPWHVLRAHQVVGMPQVYLWGKDPAGQLRRAVDEWAALGVPVACSLGAWGTHTPAAVLEAGVALRDLALRGACLPVADLWSLEHMPVARWTRPCGELAELLAGATVPVRRTYRCRLDSTWYRLAALARLGYWSGPLTGGWSELSRQALQRAQAALGVAADGIWGPKTAAAVEAAEEVVRA